MLSRLRPHISSPDTSRETRIGTENGLPIYLYANPSSKRFRTFITDLYHEIQTQYLTDDIPTQLLVYPTAPQVRTRAAAVGTEYQHLHQTLVTDQTSRYPSQTEVAEAVYAVRDATDTDTMMQYLKNISTPGDPCTRPREKLWTYASDLNVSPIRVRDALQNGTYRGFVRQNSREWWARLSSGSYLAPTGDCCLWVQNETPTNMAVDTVSGMIEAALADTLSDLDLDTNNAE